MVFVVALGCAEALGDMTPGQLAKVTQIREGVVELGIAPEIIRARVAEYLEGLDDV
jgi:hypothetical protein